MFSETPDAVPATMEDLLRIHTASFLNRFKAVSEAGSGDLGNLASFSVAQHAPSAQACEILPAGCRLLNQWK